MDNAVSYFRFSVKSYACLIVLVSTVCFLLFLNKTKTAPQKITEPSESRPQEHIKEFVSKTYTPEPVAFTSSSPQEAFETAKLIRFCRHVPRLEHELNDWVSNAYGVGEPFEFINDMQERFKPCSAVAHVDISYIDLLLSAARNGSDDAVAELWAIGDAEFINQHRSFNEKASSVNWQGLQLFKGERYALAERSALNGNEESIIRLIKAYQHYDPETKNHNKIKSLAFADFALAVLDNGEVYRKAYWFKEKFIGELKYRDVMKAQVMTENMIARFKTRQQAL